MIPAERAHASRATRLAPLAALGFLLALVFPRVPSAQALLVAHGQSRPAGLVVPQPLVAAVWTQTVPAGWTRPNTIVCVTVTDDDALLDVSTEYRVSTDNGVTWGEWSFDAALEHSAPSINTVHVTLTLVALVESATDNLVQFRVQDYEGTIEYSPVWVIQVDDSHPVTTHSLNPPLPASGWYTGSVTIDLLPWDSVSGVAYTLWKQAGEIMWRVGNTIVVDSSGTYYYRSVDNAGNEESPIAITLQIDAQPPQTIPTYSPPRPDNGWFNTTVTVTLVPTDASSGVSRTQWQRLGDTEWVSGTVVVVTDSVTLRFYSADLAGNNESVVELVVGIDRDPPATTHQLEPPTPAGGWYSGTVDLTFVATDTVSGVADTRWRTSGGPWISGSSLVLGQYAALEYHSTDNAGNTETPHSLVVRIDTRPPTSTLSLAPVPPASGWYSQPVSVTIQGADDLSGWVGDSFWRLGAHTWEAGTTVVITSSGVHSLQFYSRDVAGNAEPVQERSPVCSVDRVPPTVTATVQSVSAWSQPPVTLTFAAGDLYSGVSQIEYRRQGTVPWVAVVGASANVPVALPDGSHVYEYRGRDIAGNVSVPQTVTVNVDSTPPGQPIRLAATPSYWVNVNGGFGLTWTNPADRSGIAGVYYQLDEDPVVGGTPLGPIVGENVSSLAGLAVAGQGSHDVYIWLRDGAGNSTPYARQVLTSAFKYDVTAPYSDGPIVTGPRGLDPLYYTGPATVTVTGHDSLSGVAAFHFQVEGQPEVTLPVTGNLKDAQRSFVAFYEGSRKVLSCWTTDAAGNIQAVANSLTLYFDSLAPGAPLGLTVTPASWTRANAFTVTWTNPPDYSGVGAAYYRLGVAPRYNTDGQMESLPLSTSRITGVLADSEGQTPLYVWLRDRAGNLSYTTAVSALLRYDDTAPVTALASAGTLGRNGYYVTPVALTFQPSDNASGVRRTLYRINNGALQEWTGQSLTLDQEGNHTVTFYSIDQAGNEELLQQRQFKLDLQAPICDLNVASDYTTALSAEVSWLGRDSGAGSGVEKYVVEYRRDGCSAWQTWYAATGNTSGTFSGLLPNHYYYFRARCEDRAGLVSWWTYGVRDAYVYVEGLVNASFDACNASGWVAAPDNQGMLTTRVVTAPAPGGGSSCMVRLNKDDWPADRPGVPMDAYASIYQAIQLPPGDCDEGLTLFFRYHILTYDVVYSYNDQKWYDSFEVYVRDRDGNELARLLLDGYRGPHTPGTLYDLGWKHFSADLAPWAGQQIRVEFKVFNRNDSWYPTWVYVDGVQLLPSPGRAIDIPLLHRGGSSGGGEEGQGGTAVQASPWVQDGGAGGDGGRGGVAPVR